jgi:Spy/CpxP family protein refolding chaperone
MTQITRSKWFVVSFVVMLATNVVLLFMLFRNTDSAVEKRGSTFSQMVRDLQLDSAQQLIFRQRKDSFMKSMKPLWEDIRKSKYELYRQLQDVNTPDSVIHLLTLVIGEKTVISEEMQFKHFRELRTVCTPEQQARFDTLVPQMTSRYRNRPQSRTSSPR